MVAVALANGRRLARVLVLKSLLKSMYGTLVDRLGGMVNRPICLMPFSRKLVLDPEFISQAHALHASCLKHHGILLATSEHILSFKLISIERLVSGDFQIAGPLLQLQRWIETNARDVLDESDELFDVKFQLIYTLGAQRMMDAQPERWLVVHNLFDLIERHIPHLEKEHPNLIEVYYFSKPSFPRLRLLSTGVAQDLIGRLCQDVVNSKFPGLSFERCIIQVKAAIRRFLQETKVSDEDCQTLKESFGERLAVMQKLLLLQGYLVYKILSFVLQDKRWSVDYGLHPTRCLSAVPYRAKGIPAPSADFGHPDVAVALTCLSYYYTGLADTQIREVLEHSQRTDDPSGEYSFWIEEREDLPAHLRHWNAINLDDDRMCYEEIFPRLRYGKRVCDFYMANVVFPKEGKEFDEKLSTTAWDMVSKKAQHVTTGFSGTNDSRFLLPLSIHQQDLPELQHTSGQVLDFLLRE